MTKKFFLSRLVSQEPYIIWLSFMVEMCKMIISPGVFFSAKILIFQVVKRLKGQIMDQNDKNFCLLHLIFQEPYIIWYDLYLCYTCMYKRIISPGIFCIFFSQNFDFWDYWGGREGGGVGKRAENCPIWQRIMSVSLRTSGTIHHVLWFLVHMCKMMIYPANFFVFQNFNFGGF